MTTLAGEQSVLDTRRGMLTLVLLCAVQFLDIVDSSIMNVALPSIRQDLGFSQQGLQWVLSGYVLTFGGFLLLGGRAADLLGRRRLLVTGTIVFALCSLIGGLAPSAGTLVAARVAQGIGAAMMAPAGLSILTTTFAEGRDRNKAFGVWGAVSGLAAATGVLLGGVLSAGPGWRWVLLVNIPVCAAIVVASFRLIPAESRRARLANFDALGAVLVTSGMLLLVYALVKAPDSGWGTARTIGELATAGLLLVGFVINELRSRNPLFPFSILRIKGLAAADATQLMAFAGFISTFFFVTLYMQNVLGYSPIEGGLAYLPVTVGVGLSAGLSAQLFGRIGTRPVIVAGTLIAACGHVLPLAASGRRVVRQRSAARTRRDVTRARRRLRLRHHRGQRRRARRQGRSRRRPHQHVAAARVRARARDLLRDRDRNHDQPAERTGRRPAARAHRRLPRRAPRLLDLPPGRYRVRAAHRELPRRGLRAYHLTPKD